MGIRDRGAALVEHWNGKAWSVVSSPNPNGTYATLNSVTSVPGSSHLLAGGYYALPSSSKSGYVVEQTLAEMYV